jgi:hypothetical protein
MEDGGWRIEHREPRRWRAILDPPSAILDRESPDLLGVGQLIDALMRPGHFFVAPGLRLAWTAARAEEVPWEVFRGRLLDPAQTRLKGSFLSWHVTEAGADEPLLAVRFDVRERRVHVTRGVLCHVWEGYDSGAGVILSRAATRWTRELVGSIELDRLPEAEELRDELACLIWQAVVGTSRLPLHSVEAPLPGFSFGSLYAFYRPWVKAVDAPLTSWQALLDEGVRAEVLRRERAKVLEFVLRHVTPAEVPAAAEHFLSSGGGAAAPLFRTMFNDVYLSPYTDFVNNALAFLRALVSRGGLSAADHTDLLAHLLRQLGRHLTAYDLVTFHHRGANYPDALMLDAVLADYLGMIEAAPGRFTGDDSLSRLRRRALRQGCLLRRHYEGHFVPDVPTSAGENARVLPAPHVRVPDDQLLNPHRRSRRLFADDPLVGRLGPRARDVLRQSFNDLGDAVELAELGTGLFIDRPLGFGKAAAEPDQTPLIAHEAISADVALRRLKDLALLAREAPITLPPSFFDVLEQRLRDLRVRGLPAAQLAEPSRPTVSLADVRRVADDFFIVRTLPGGLAELLGVLDCPALRPGPIPRLVAVVQSDRGPVLGFFDDNYRCRCRAAVDPAAGFFHRAGIEWPVAVTFL